jgi:hypothetical protein
VVVAMLHGVRQAPIYPDLGGHRLRPRRPLHLSDADRVPASALRAQVSESSYTNPSSKRAVSGVRQFVYRWMTFCSGSRSSTSRTSWPMSIRYSDSSSRWNAFSRAGSNPKTEPPSLLKSRYRAHPPRPELWSHRRGAGVGPPRASLPPQRHDEIGCPRRRRGNWNRNRSPGSRPVDSFGDGERRLKSQREN